MKGLKTLKFSARNIGQSLTVESDLVVNYKRNHSLYLYIEIDVFLSKYFNVQSLVYVVSKKESVLLQFLYLEYFLVRYERLVNAI